MLAALAHHPEVALGASARLLNVLDPLLRTPGSRVNATLQRLAPWLDEWIAHPSADAYWMAQSPAAYYARMRTPGLHVSGWYDPFLSGVIANFRGMQALAPQRLIVGPWLHASFEPCPPHRVGELDFGADADLDFPALQRRWFDHWLKDVPNGVLDEAPVRVFVMGENRWRDEPRWPPVRARWTRWYVHGDGSLSVWGPGDGESTDTFVHNPADPVPTLGGAVLPGAVLAGPFDQRAIEQRGDVLVYTSDVLTEAMEVTGAVEVVLWTSSSTADADYVARLVDVYPDGRAINLCEGIARVASDEGREVRIDLHATSNLFAAGHRVRLDVTSSSYPHYAVNRRGGRQTVHHDAARPSHLRLPVIPR